MAAGSGGTAAGTGGSAGSVGPKAGNGGTVTPGQGGTLNTTQIVGPGQTFDGGGKRYTAGRALGDGSQSEGQQPMFRVEAGGTLKNVVLGSPAADGIHTYGNATLENIVWEDIGEDAMKIKESVKVSLLGFSYSL
jgi:pectate lyase C